MSKNRELARDFSNHEERKAFAEQKLNPVLEVSAISITAALKA